MRYALIALLLTGCSLIPSNRQQHFVGQPLSAVIEDMGVPNRTITTNGTTYSTWLDGRACEWTFASDAAGVVTGYTYKGIC